MQQNAQRDNNPLYKQKESIVSITTIPGNNINKKIEKFDAISDLYYCPPKVLAIFMATPISPSILSLPDI